MTDPVDRAPALGFDPIERAGELWAERFGRADAMRVATSVMRVQQLLLARFDAALKAYDITFARYEVLVLLHFSRRGSLPLKIIGERLQVHPTSVTNSVARLVAAGLVVRRPNPADGRGALAGLTAKGRRVVRDATADLMAADFGLSVLDGAGRAAVFSQLRAVRRAAGDFTD